MFVEWQAPLASGATATEMALQFENGRERRVLIVPPLFDEHNKFRRQAVEIMRKLDRVGIDSVLPDLPGCNESSIDLSRQTLANWRAGLAQAEAHFSATHALAIRSGSVLLPTGLPAFVYAPQKGSQLLRSMIRARTVAAREVGRDEKAQDLLDAGREEGVELAGWHLGAQMVRELERAEYEPGPSDRVIEQSQVGGSPLWLRAEPGEDLDQAVALVEVLVSSIDAAE